MFSVVSIKTYIFFKCMFKYFVIVFQFDFVVNNSLLYEYSVLT